MGKEWKAIEDMERRLKAIEESLGLGSHGARNIHMLLDTIGMQGQVENQLKGKMKDMQGMIQGVLTQRDAFLKDNNLTDKFTEWANKKAAEEKAAMEARKAAEEAAKVARLSEPKDPALQEKAPITDEREQVKEADGMIKAEPKKQIVTEDKIEDAKKAIEDSKKEIVNDA